MIDKLKSISKNSNIRVCLYIVILLLINAFIGKYHVRPSTVTYDVLLESGIYGSAMKMESIARTYYVWNTPVIALFGVLVLFNVLLDLKFLTSSTLTKIAKFTIVPFAVIYSVYLCYSVYDLINTQNMIIQDQFHKTYVSDISLETLDEISDIKPNAIIYIEKDGCPSCIKVSNIIDNISYANNIHILRYDTIYDRDQREDFVKKVLEKYNVYEVPCVLMIKDGQIFAGYQYQDIVNGVLFKDIESEISKGVSF